MSWSQSRDFLNTFGWSSFFDQQLDLEDLNHLPARVCGEERGLYRLQVGHSDTRLGFVSGSWRHEARGRRDFPAVGDWILCSDSGDPERLLIERILQRKTLLERKQIGARMDSQILAANVDQVFITTSLNADFNLARIERYLALVLHSGAQPILLLSKADLCANASARIAETQERLRDLPIVVTSVMSGTGLEEVASYLKVGTTSVFVGSSGVGKSSLLNYFLRSLSARPREAEAGAGAEAAAEDGMGARAGAAAAAIDSESGHVEWQLKTQEVRASDGKGRHTTTSRYLFVANTGGLVIDTPGMREIQILDAEEALSQEFSAIEDLAQRCRFTDCSHASEPGCKIREALQRGEVIESQWQNYLKLRRELEFTERKHNKALAAAQKAQWKKIHENARAQRRFKEEGSKQNHWKRSR